MRRDALPTDTDESLFCTEADREPKGSSTQLVYAHYFANDVHSAFHR